MDSKTEIYFGTVGILTSGEHLGLGVYSHDIKPVKNTFFFERTDCYYDLFTDEKYKKKYSDCYAGDMIIIPDSIMTFDEYIEHEDAKDAIDMNIKEKRYYDEKKEI